MRRKYRRKEARWILEIPLSDIWERFGDEFTEYDIGRFTLLLSNRLKEYLGKIEELISPEASIELESLAEKIEKARTADEVDEILDELYDWADWNGIWLGS